MKEAVSVARGRFLLYLSCPYPLSFDFAQDEGDLEPEFNITLTETNLIPDFYFKQ